MGSIFRRTHTLLLRTIPFKNTSLILEGLTREYGRESFILKGAYTKKTKTELAYLQPFFLVELTYYYKETRNLQIIKEISLGNLAYHHLNFSLKARLLIQTSLELIYSLFPEKAGQKKLFSFIIRYLKKLPHYPEELVFHLWHWLHFSRFLGILPRIASSLKDKAAPVKLNIAHGTFESAYIENRAAFYLKELVQNKISKVPIEVQKQSINLLWRYYQYHVPNFKLPHSYTLWQQVSCPRE